MARRRAGHPVCGALAQKQITGSALRPNSKFGAAATDYSRAQLRAIWVARTRERRAMTIFVLLNKKLRGSASPHESSLSLHPLRVNQASIGTRRRGAAEK